MLELLSFIDNLYPISAEAQAALFKICREKSLRKGQHWLKEGEICTHLAFIKRGLMKGYFDTGGKEVALWFHREKDAVLSAHSFFSQMPSGFSIRCEAETELIIFSFTEMQHLIEKHPELNRHARMILQNYICLSEMHISLLLRPAKQRFDTLVLKYKWMINDPRITDKMLAAYIGVTPNCISYYKNGRYEERRRTAG